VASEALLYFHMILSCNIALEFVINVVTIFPYTCISVDGRFSLENCGEIKMVKWLMESDLMSCGGSR